MLSQQQKQDILEFGVMQIVTQCGPAWDEWEGVCRYCNDENGSRCFIGSMLDTNMCRECDADEEGLSAGDLVRRGVNGWSGDRDAVFLTELQKAHDLAASDAYDEPRRCDEEKRRIFFEAFSRRIAWVCCEHNLRYPEELI